MKIRNLLTALIVSLVATGSSVAIAADTTYHFGVSEQRTNISFQSETDFETILGSSRSLEGAATVDLDAGKVDVNLSVPVVSLRTGIDLRDKHLNSGGWLDSKKFPNLSFTASTARMLSETQWEVEGVFTMHGVSQQLTTIVEIRQIPEELARKAGMEKGNWVKIVAPFEIKLSDFGVVIPKKVAGRVNDTWEVRVQAFASTVGP